MAKATNIEWCDATLNLWWGCTKVSAGCKFCYADVLSRRWGKSNWGPKGTREEKTGWRKTLKEISKRAKEEGRRLRVFCSSMSDVFEGPETMGGPGSENWIRVSNLREELLKAVIDHPDLDFLVLTKRPENVMLWGPTMMGWCREEGFPPNFWIGTSCEDQESADERIPLLLKIPAKVRFLSCEPLLGPIDFYKCSDSWYSEQGYKPWANAPILTGIHWVICGGESGPSARPMSPVWARSLRDQCQAAGVACFLKQWGQWVTEDQSPEDIVLPSESFALLATWDEKKFEYVGDLTQFYKVGKHKAGRLLDGQEWSQFPEVDS